MTEAQGRVGRWLRNKWHLDSLIAIGGMAAVYASTHRNGARAAIKMLHSQYTRNEQARRRFLAEGYAANKVGHRNAVLVLDDDATEDGEVYLVMELLEGESLEGRLERLGVMGPMEVLALTDQLLEVLACAHPKGILHRDIKPANIYLTRDGAVKLLDFGLARVRELSAEAMDQSDGIVFGTVSYIAPEQARADNQNLDARSDMWSIAATMFRALSGETVHPSTGPVIDRLMAVARKPPRSIASVVPHLPRQVIELVDRALAFDPENRWPSANVMRVVVQDVMAQLREEADAQGGDDEMTGMFARPPLGSGIATRHRTGAELPAVRSGPTPPAADAPPRPKTDPVALSMRPRSLQGRAAEELDVEVDLEAEPRPEQKGRRSRTLLTKEGRAELRRILDARKGVSEGKAEEPTPRPMSTGLQVTESGTAEIDVEVDDSIIEVTIDHTHRGRPGPIAEALADNTTPAPVRAERTTGGFATVPEDRRAAPAQAPTPPVAPARSGLDDSRSRRESPAAVAGLDDSRSRRAQAARSSGPPATPEERRTASTASYPTLGGATSKPIQAPGRATPEPPRPTARNEEITRVAPAPTSPSAEPSKGPPPISGEIGTRGPAEITRVGPPPAPLGTSAARSGPPPRPNEGPRPTGMHDTLRPKTIPPVSARSSAPRAATPRPEAKVEVKPSEVTPAPVKVEARPQARVEPVREVTPAPVKIEATRGEITPAPVKVEARAEPTPAPVTVELRPQAAREAESPIADPAQLPESPKSGPARAGVFAAPPSRGGPVSRPPVAGPSEPQRGATPPAGFALPSRAGTRPGASEPVRAATPRSPIGSPSAPAAAPAPTSPAAPVAPAPTSPAAPVAPAATAPPVAPAAPSPAAPVAPAPAAAVAPATASRASASPARAPVPAAGAVLPPRTTSPLAAPRQAEPAAAPPPAEATPEPVSKDSEAEAAAQPGVPAEEPAREPKLKAGAPVLPFSFLRPGPATRPGEAPGEPKGDGTPPRKKS